MDLVLIMPAYNEEKRIEKTLKEYLYFFNKIKKDFKCQIILVINNTQDKTEDIAKNFLRKGDLKIINLIKGGKGYAIREGFKKALTIKTNYIGFVDADLATAPSEIYKLFKKLDNEKSADGIIGSRYVSGAKVFPKQSLKRILASRVYNILIRVLFLLPYIDTQCGAKIFKKEAIKQIVEEMQVEQWGFDVELIYLLKKKRFEILEEPTVWSDKEYSKLNFFKAGPKMVIGLLKLRIIKSPLGKLFNGQKKISKN